jgi:hypothetical protein
LGQRLRDSQGWCQIVPLGILALDQIQLPVAVPALEIADIAKLVEDAEAAPKARGLYKKRGG